MERHQWVNRVTKNLSKEGIQLLLGLRERNSREPKTSGIVLNNDKEGQQNSRLVACLLIPVAVLRSCMNNGF